MNLVLNCNNLSKNFDKYKVISNLDLQLFSGQILSITKCGNGSKIRFALVILSNIYSSIYILKFI